MSSARELPNPFGPVSISDDDVAEDVVNGDKDDDATPCDEPADQGRRGKGALGRPVKKLWSMFTEAPESWKLKSVTCKNYKTSVNRRNKG